MAKDKKKRFGKGLIIVAVLTVLTIAAGVASVMLLSQNTTIAQIFGGVDNVYESARLEKMTINGHAVGDELTSEIKEYLVLDGDFSYYYDDVGFWEKDGIITGIGFYTFTNSDGETVTSIEDSKIVYEKRELKTIEDFEETFGLGELTNQGNSSTLTYYQGDYKLTIQCRNDEIQNVILQKQE